MMQAVLIRLFAWGGEELRLARLLALTLLLAALNCVALGLSDIVRGLDLGLLFPITVLGVLSAWILAVSPWPGWLAGSIIFMAGVVTIITHVGRLAGAVAAWLGEFFNLAWGVIWRWSLNNLPEVEPFLWITATLEAKVQTLLSRLFDWIFSLAAGEPVFDPVAVVLVWTLALWSVAAWSGWMVRRHDQVLWGILPAGTLLVVSQAYVGGNFTYLLLLLGLTWLLLALVEQMARERRWEAARIDYSLEIRADMAMVTIWLTVALVSLAQLTPSVSIRQVAEVTQRLIWGQAPQPGPLASSLGLKPPVSPPTVFDTVRIGGLPRQHLLGSGPELLERVVMAIQVIPGALPFQSAAHPTYYWRSLTYDRYTGRGWLTSRTETADYSAGQPALSPRPEGQPVRQQVQVVNNRIGLLHAAGLLVTVDQPYKMAWRSSGDAFGAMVEAKTYQADSLLLLASEAELRAAGHSYPKWVQRRYLALPNKTPTRVLTLARNLTVTEPTPYDRARAIEAYLRSLPYDLNIPAPPRDQDVVDYFLFDLRRGYCDYYATAMVVLARAAGLPARLVMGYAGGTYDPANARYVVTEADAHSWPEVYFPGYGWIEFEPTASRPAGERPVAAGPAWPPEMDTPDSELTPTPSAGLSPLWGWGLTAGLAGLALAGAAWILVDAWWLRCLPPAATVERLYRRLVRYGRWLAVPVWAGETPYEFSDLLVGRVDEQAGLGRWRKWLAPVTPEVYRLTDLYVQMAYSAHPPDSGHQTQAIRSWRRLRWRLGLAWLRFKLERLKVLRLNP